MNVEEHLAPFARDGRLCVGGIELGRLAEQVGSTPFFARCPISPFEIFRSATGSYASWTAS